MKFLNGSDIETALTKQLRVYLCGDLQRSDNLEHIPTERYEIGISDYKTDTFEKAHVHTFNTEFNYVERGMIKIFLINERKEYLFRQGDLFVIEPNEPYVGKSKAGSRTIFSKVPGGNDKQLVPMSDALLVWGASWDAEYPEDR